MPTATDLPQRRLEVDLAIPVEAFFSRRLGRRWDFAQEIELRNAGPDLVAGRRAAAFAVRAADGPPPITAELTLRLVDFLGTRATDTELRAWAPWGWRDLRRRAIEPAVAHGLVGFDGGRWTAPTVKPPYDRIVAIELKLLDWRKGVRQARRNQAFANESWLALERVGAEALDLAAQLGVGVVRVGPEGRVEVLLDAVPREPVAALETRLVGEQILQQALEQLAPDAKKLRPLAGSPRGRKLAVHA